MAFSLRTWIGAGIIALADLSDDEIRELFASFPSEVNSQIDRVVKATYGLNLGVNSTPSQMDTEAPQG